MRALPILLAMTMLSAGVADAARGKKPTKAELMAQQQAEEEEARKAAEEVAAAKAVADAAAAEHAAAEKSAQMAADAAEKARADATDAKQKALEARGLDARMRALADALAIALKRLPGDHRDQRFAVIPFENVGDEAQQKSLGLVVSDLLVTDLARDHRLNLVERGQVSAVMGELAIQQSGAVPEGQITTLGEMAGARALIVGQVSDGGDVFIVTARAISAEDGTVIVAEDVKLPKAELVAFSADAVVLKSKSAAMFRSMVLPGWGQSYNNQTVKGFILGGLTGGLAVATITSGALGVVDGYVTYPNVHQSDAAKGLTNSEVSALVESTRQRADIELTTAAVLAGATAIAWGFTVADAYLSGTDVESLDAALARN